MKSQRSTPQEKASSSRSTKSAVEAIPLIEWIVGGLGLILLVSVVTFLIYEGVTGKSTPPEIVVESTSIQAQQQGHVVTIAIHNLGGQAASKVLISGELLNAEGAPIEESQTEIDFLPAGSDKNAGLFFTHDPRQHQLKLRPLGYEEP